jgi:hypothetical protein
VRIFEYHRSHLHAKVAVTTNTGPPSARPTSTRSACCWPGRPTSSSATRASRPTSNAPRAGHHAGAREISPTPGNAARACSASSTGARRAGAPDDRHRRLRQRH